MTGYFIFSIISSIVFALLEIQIEGESGWAEKLPTWRKEIKLIKIFTGGNMELTGYHTYLWIFILLLCHSAFIIVPWSTTNELRILSYICFVILFEDFFWFVLNPRFGLKKFNKKNIKWHKNWLGPFPIQYYWGFLFWLALFLAPNFL